MLIYFIDSLYVNKQAFFTLNANADEILSDTDKLATHINH